MSDDLWRQRIIYLPMFFLSLGCIGAKGEVVGTSFVIFLISLYFGKADSVNKNDFKNNIIKISVTVMACLLVTVWASALFHNNHGDVKEGLHYLERMIPFFLVLLYGYKGQKILLPAWSGALVGILYIDIVTLYQVLQNCNVRPTGVSNDPNILGAMLLFSIPLIFFGSRKFPYANSKIRIIGSAVSIITIVALFFSGSRGAIGGLIAANLFYVVFSTFVTREMSMKQGLIWLGTCLLVASVGFEFLTRSILRSYDGERLLLWQSGLNMFKDYPVFGTGITNFKDYYIGKNYISPAAKELNLLTLHNIYVQVLATTGIVGFLGFASVFVYQIKVLYHYLRETMGNNKWVFWSMASAIVGILVHGIVDTIFLNRNIMMDFWMLWGIVAYLIVKNNCDEGDI